MASLFAVERVAICICKDAIFCGLIVSIAFAIFGFVIYPKSFTGAGNAFIAGIENKDCCDGHEDTFHTNEFRATKLAKIIP